MPRRIGLAVSGGGDSMAMLWLIAPRARELGIEVAVATVDHGLRAESADEARWVGEVCEGLGLPHRVLRWDGWDGRGNLQAEARNARHGLLAAWARGAALDAILLGHTHDDQAETFVMRLARGSGVDGLAPIRAAWRDGDVRWLRPLLDLRRGDLREFLRRNGRPWIEDPSNEDGRFARVRARAALAALEPLGIGVERIGTTAVRMGWASEALARYAAEAAESAAVARGGEVRLDVDLLIQLPYETQMRLTSAAIRWVSSTPYRPRLGALQQAMAGAVLGRRTLQGAILGPHAKPGGRSHGPGWIVVTREPRAASLAPAASTDALWDGRWRLYGPHAPGLTVRMLGEGGLALCPDWRAAGLLRTSLIASPAVWRGAALEAAPLAGRAEGWRAEVEADFVDVVRGA